MADENSQSTKDNAYFYKFVCLLISSIRPVLCSMNE